MEATFLSALPWGDLGLGSLVAMTIVGLIFGWIVPVKRVNTERRIYENQIAWVTADRNAWHDAYDELSKALPLIAGQLEKLTTANETNVALLSAIKRLSEGDNHGH